MSDLGELSERQLLERAVAALEELAGRWRAGARFAGLLELSSRQVANPAQEEPPAAPEIVQQPRPQPALAPAMQAVQPVVAKAPTREELGRRAAERQKKRALAAIEAKSANLPAKSAAADLSAPDACPFTAGGVGVTEQQVFDYAESRGITFTGRNLDAVNRQRVREHAHPFLRV